ncbi:MAG: hypothetical protein [Caudoviricetes sp.]|nr:MAG: hypothetical protein [Caudoviricetes sp.]
MTKKKAPKANIPDEMPMEADEELQTHFKQPAYVVKFEDGAEACFNLDDIVALSTDIVDKTTYYTVALISGTEFEVDKDTYNDLKHFKQWDDVDNKGTFKKD